MQDLIKIYTLLNTHYGNLNWWPAITPYEVIVGAILTQNTNWSNVQKALANFPQNNKPLTPQYIETAPTEELSELIRPAGFFNQKTTYLKAITKWFKQYNYSVEEAKKQDLSTLRKQLLSTKGIGKETADSILLYTLNLPSFVIDAYTRRLLTRVGYPNIPKQYDDLKTIFETNLPKDVALYNNYHACIVINAKEHCKSKPICKDCPLSKVCKHSQLNLKEEN